MDRLIPGYAALVEQELDRLAGTYRLDRLPWAPAIAAGAIHVVDTRQVAEAWANRLHNERISLLGVDTEFAFDGPEIELRNGDQFVDLATIRPQVCSIAAWCAEDPTAGDKGDPLIRLLFDLRRTEVLPALRDIFQLHVPWVAHEGKAELHCLWACGIEPTEHLLIDTFITAACLNLGRFHRRQSAADPEEAIARDRKLKAKAAHVTSLVGQCAHYGFPHPFAQLKDQMRREFMELGPNDPLDEQKITYAVSDAEYALRVHLAQAEDVHRQGLAPHLAAIEWPLVGVIARMEMAGLPFDSERADRYRELCRSIAAEMARRLSHHGIKPGSRDSFLKVMNAAGLIPYFLRDGKPSTKQETLRVCERLGLHDAIQPFRLHLYFSRLADSDFLSGRLVGADGRVRGSLYQIGAVSGRIASSKPNSIGLDGRLRPVVVARPGHVLIEVDKSQIEVGIAGAEWDDPALIELFNKGDAYANIAQSFYRDQLTSEERSLTSTTFKDARPDLRNQVKTLVLGILYGRGARSIATAFGCSLDHAEAELLRFFDHFPRARDNAERAVRASLRRGWGLTSTGLRRHVERGGTQFRNALRNHPIQGSAAAIFKAALIRIDRYYRGTPTRLLLPRHDSALLETPEGTEQEVSATCTTFMVMEVRAVYPQLRPRVKSKDGRSWPTDQTLEDYYSAECPG
jgi:DNA polymerase-1